MNLVCFPSGNDVSVEMDPGEQNGATVQRLPKLGTLDSKLDSMKILEEWLLLV